MRQHQQSHIMACCSTSVEHLRAIRQVVESGQAPDGRRFAVLPQPDRDKLAKALERIARHVEEVAAAFAPEARKRADQCLDVSATRMWLKVMLLFIRDQLRELLPETMGRRYGDVEEAEAASLRSQIKNLVRELDGAVALVGEIARSGV